MQPAAVKQGFRKWVPRGLYFEIIALFLSANSCDLLSSYYKTTTLDVILHQLPAVSDARLESGLVLWFYGQTCYDYWISLCSVSQMRLSLKYKLVLVLLKCLQIV